MDKVRRKKKLKLDLFIFILGLVCVAVCGVLGYRYVKERRGNAAVTVMSDGGSGGDGSAEGTPGAVGDESAVDGADGSTGTLTTEATTEEVTTEDPAVIEERRIDSEIDGMLSQMTLEEKVGQMFFVRCDASYDQTTFDTYHPGGLLLFGTDVKDKTYEGLQQYIDGFQGMSKVPLFIGIDEEGGTVTRISGNSNLTSHAWKSPRQLYAEGGMDAVIVDSHEKSVLLSDLGINVNFAPVVDYSVNPGEFMYDRAFGDDIDDTCEFAEEIVSAMKEDGMGSVLKHFPGYGGNGDTHTSIVTDTRDYSTFTEQDFLPFEAGIEAGAECVLVCHNIVTCMDGEWPASLSEKVHEELRSTLGFDGVIITDDLAMDGVADFCTADAAAVQAVKAGNDMMIVSDLAEQYEAVLAAAKSGEITETRIDESARRILRWKYHLGVIQ